MMPCVITASAERELDEAVEWYRQQQEGLQSAFLQEFLSTVARIQAQPEIYTTLRPGIRRGLLRRFPYSVIYELSDGTILIFADTKPASSHPHLVRHQQEQMHERWFLNSVGMGLKDLAEGRVLSPEASEARNQLRRARLKT